MHERLGESEWGRRIRGEVNMKEYDAKAWVKYQKEAFTLWVNARLSSAPEPMRKDVKVTDLFRDMRNGLVLYYLVAVLSRGELAKMGKPHVGDSVFFAMQNVSLVLKYLSRFLVNERQQLPDAAHVVEGKPVAVLSLIWWIITHYDQQNGGFHSERTSFKSSLLQWASTTTKDLMSPEDRRTRRLSRRKSEEERGNILTDEDDDELDDVMLSCDESFIQDGRLFLALLHAADPENFPLIPREIQSSISPPPLNEPGSTTTYR